MPTTKSFFEKQGYKVKEKLKLDSDGVEFNEFKMEKKF